MGETDCGETASCFDGQGHAEFSSLQLRLLLWSHGPQHAKLPCPSPTPRGCSNLCLSQWCHPTISLSVIPISSCLQSFPASGSFPMNQVFASGGQIIGASVSVLPMNIQKWFLLRLAGWISLQSKELTRVFSNTTVQKHQFFGAQLSLWAMLSKSSVQFSVDGQGCVLSLFLAQGQTVDPCLHRRLLDTHRQVRLSLPLASKFKLPGVLNPFAAPQFGKSVVSPRTLLTMWEFLWYNCSADCGSSAQWG